MSHSLIDLYKSESASVVTSLDNNEINAFLNMVLDAYEKESKIFACGNGGNVASVGNLVVDLNMHPFVSDDKSSRNTSRNKFCSISLCQCPATITGISNDLGFEHIFTEQLRYQGSKGDILLGITGSGNSKNVINALKFAKTVGMKCIVITRSTGHCLADDVCDLVVRVRGESTFPGQTGKNNNNFHFEDCISKITHIAVGILKKRVQDGN
jgi:D-sedoheptulose 7-phosphate isomerase